MEGWADWILRFIVHFPSTRLYIEATLVIMFWVTFVDHCCQTGDNVSSISECNRIIKEKSKMIYFVNEIAYK